MEPSSAPWRVLESSEPAAAAARPTPGGRPWIAIGAALAAAAVAIGALALAPRTEPVVGVDGANAGAALLQLEGLPSRDAAALPAGDTTLVIEVGGAVARPGVYRLPAGSRVGDAIAAAGGYGSRVDAAAADRALNLAAPVRDGDEIHVPARGEAAAASGGTGGSGGAGGSDPGGTGGGGDPGGSALIDLNRASAEQLDTLPGVGPATAAKIIAAREERPFASIDDVGARKVVGAAVLEKIRTLVTVGP